MVLIIAQIVGISAVALYLMSFQLKRRGHIVLVTCISNCLYVLQYFLLGAFSGAFLDALSTVSSFLAGKKNAPRFRKYAGFAAFATIVLIIGVGLVFAIGKRDWVELLPIGGAIFQTTGLWFDNEQTIRKFALVGTPFWLAYNFISQAYGAAVGSLLTIISISVALFRYYKVKPVS